TRLVPEFQGINGNSHRHTRRTRSNTARSSLRRRRHIQQLRIQAQSRQDSLLNNRHPAQETLRPHTKPCRDGQGIFTPRGSGLHQNRRAQEPQQFRKAKRRRQGPHGPRGQRRGELAPRRGQRYPEIKADKHYLNLQHNLTEIEDQISAARRAYNAAVTDFNNSCEMFPFNLFASVFGLSAKPLFQVNEAQRANVRVQ
ncbi:MAG TPA: hypothetical protein DCX07_10520, partial [Phycisphaerales bacterium]|nr:hypothetical protein [Phycisphaerales bacterium]